MKSRVAGCLIALIATLGLLVDVQAQTSTAPMDFATPKPKLSADELLRRAQQQLNTGMYDLAESGFHALLDDEDCQIRDDCQAVASLGLAECLFATGRYDDAASILSDGQEYSGDSANWYVLRAEVAGAVGDYKEGIRLAREARGKDQTSCKARLVLARFLEAIGESDAALDEYRWFDRLVQHRLPIDAENLTAAGAGFYRYSVLAQHRNLTQRTRHVLQQIYQKAYTHIDPTYWPARLAVADLLLEKFSHEEAADDYRAVLDVNSNAVAAHVGLGWIAINRWQFEEVDLRTTRALDVNTNSVEAMVLRAFSRILERRFEAAGDVAQHALDVNSNSIEALALKASARMALYDNEGAQRSIAKAQRVNPTSGTLHQILAHALASRRQFAESEAHFLKAIEFEPSNATAQADLGLMYMQWGDEPKARKPLEKAWKLDPFNARTKNTLDLLDELDQFARVVTEHFDVRCERGHDERIASQTSEYLESIYDLICKRFEIDLDRKTIVEIFPAHGDFGVRVTGKPWIDTVGACTGWVIAVDAPRSGKGGQSPFHLPNVLRHEFVHTVTLAMTNNRIPHWMTEGLAVLHEDRPPSYKWKQVLADRIRKGELFSLDAVDWGFSRPRRQDDRLMAYAQSEWMCEFLLERFGDGVINAMLLDFKNGKSQPTVFAKHTKLSTEEFDAAFSDWARMQAAPWGFDLTPPEDTAMLAELAAKKPNDASLLARLAMAEVEAGRIDESLDAARKSLAVDANSNALGHEAMMLALSAELRHGVDPASVKSRAEKILEHAHAVLRCDPSNRAARMVVALNHTDRNRTNAALPHLLDLLDLKPVDPIVHFELAKIYRKLGDGDRALPHWMACLVEYEHDANVPAEIAAIHTKASRLQDARQWYAEALTIAPLSTKIGGDYARLLMQMGDTSAAIDVYKLLCELNPTEAAFQEACALALFKSGKKDEAKTFATQAVKLNPNSEAVRLLGN